MTEHDESLADEPFDYEETQDGRIRITYHGRVVTTVSGTAARRLSERLEKAGPRDAQILMAKATGNFKRGNERRGRDRDRERDPE